MIFFDFDLDFLPGFSIISFIKHSDVHPLFQSIEKFPRNSKVAFMQPLFKTVNDLKNLMRKTFM